MNIRLRRLDPREVQNAEYDGWPLVIPLCRAGHPDEVSYAVLEYQHTEHDHNPWRIAEIE